MKLPLRTERSFVAYFFLNIITLGIYSLVQVSHIGSEVNLIASEHDGKHTMHFCWIVFIFSWLTLGIASLVWYHRISNRIGNELRRRGVTSDFGADTFWLWFILGSLIYIGPFVYIYKRIVAMNQLNDLYNKEKGY
ncbi:MAG: DUF4234 domain-containing protein [Paludibacteraceae bacterium]|nr:DUF4234 domain-containing protein [Paludibacteraceae bacterium]